VTAIGQAYVIYYGWLTADDGGEPNGEAQRVAAAQSAALF
jgi:hypothetical protein